MTLMIFNQKSYFFPSVWSISKLLDSNILRDQYWKFCKKKSRSEFRSLYWIKCIWYPLLSERSRSWCSYSASRRKSTSAKFSSRSVKSTSQSIFGRSYESRRTGLKMCWKILWASCEKAYRQWNYVHGWSSLFLWIFFVTIVELT